MANKIIPTGEFQPRFEELAKMEEQIYDLKKDQELKASSLWHDFEVKHNVRGHTLKYIKDKNIVEDIDPLEDVDKKMREATRKGPFIPSDKHQTKNLQFPMGSALPRVSFKKTSFFEKIKAKFHLKH